MGDWRGRVILVIAGAAVGGAAGASVSLSSAWRIPAAKVLRCEALELVSPSGVVIGRFGKERILPEGAPLPKSLVGDMALPESIVTLTMNSEDGKASWKAYAHSGGTTGMKMKNDSSGAAVHIGIDQKGVVHGEGNGPGGKERIHFYIWPKEGAGILLFDALGNQVCKWPPIPK